MLEMDRESLIGRERGRWRSALASGLPMFVFELSSKNHTHTPTKIVDKTTLALAWCHTCAYAECAHVCVCVRVVEVGYETVEVALVY